MTPIDRPIIILLLSVFLAMMVHPVFYIGSIIMTLDCIARYRDYLSIRDLPFNTGLVRRMSTSWCSRGVASYVWPYRAGLLYRCMNYRWYHVLPDGFPGALIRASFWMHVIGIRR